MVKELVHARHIKAKDILGLSRQQFVDSVPTSANPWEEIRAELALPENLKGLSVLDVCGGGSDATAQLLAKGANAYAVDLRYKNISGLRNAAIRYFTAVRKNDPFSKKSIREQEKTLERALASMRTQPKRYKGTSADHLPFDDNSFDIVFSNDGIIGHLDVHYELLYQAVLECLRVAKPDGVVKLLPFAYISPELPEGIIRQRAENQLRLIKELDGLAQHNLVAVKGPIFRLDITPS